jgi:hypothetical protein
MNGARQALRLQLVFFVALLFSAALPDSRAQVSRPKASTAKSVISGKNEVKPEDPTRAIIAAFNKYEVVGMDAAHGSKDLDDLILRLIRDPAFPNAVNDIVVECGNSLYQPILDRYIAGENVPESEVQKVWRDTSVSMCSVSGFYEILFPLVRRINQTLSPAKRIRVLGGDPPLDWSKVKSQSEVMLDRDGNVASVMEKEVLSKHRKALMLFGTMHLFHSNSIAPPGLESAVERYEIKYPGVTFVIGTNIVSRAPIPTAVLDEMTARMASWPVPSLVQNIKDAWLLEVENYYFSKMVDAYLYLGPAELMLAEPRPAEIFLDKDYMDELRRRAAIIGDPFLTNQTKPPALDVSPFLHGP